MRSASGKMHSTSEQLTECAAFDQTRNVWPNVHAFRQLRCTFSQIRSELDQMYKLTVLIQLIFDEKSMYLVDHSACCSQYVNLVKCALQLRPLSFCKM